MKFEQSCYIQKNTPELRKALEDLGYKYRGKSSEYGEPGSLYCFDQYYWEVYDMPTRYHSIIHCGDCEELFLSIAALRDDIPHDPVHSIVIKLMEKYNAK